MKRLNNFIASILCIAMLAGCSANMAGIGKKHIPAESQYIPEQNTKQTIIPTEEPKPLEQNAPENVVGGNPIKIALLVPLSGSYKELGQGLVDAAQLAMFRIGDANLTLIPIDTKETTYGAVEAAKKAVAEGAKIILGPVFSNSAKAIAKIATENNIQVVSFSNDKSLAGSGVFAIGLLPEQQAKRIVEFSISKGIKDFATLLPSDSYGTIITKSLRQAVENNKDASILISESYQADSQGRPLGLDEHMKPVINSIVNSKAGGAMLIPVGNAATQQMLSVLEKSNVDKSKIQLLGTDIWSDPAILKNPALEGAWFTALPRERRSDFESKFRSTYGHEAPKLSGLAYDGIALAATIAKQSNGGNFSRESLVNPRGFIGVDGIFRLQEDGLVQRGYAVMQVKGGQAVMIDAAPTSFVDFK